MSAITHLAERYWNAYLDANPSYATLIGVHDRDGVLEDLSGEAMASHAQTLAGIADELEAADRTSDPVTAALLANVIEADLTEYETEILIAPVDSYLGVHAKLIQAAAQTSVPDPEAAALIGERYAQIPRLFAQAIDRHRRLFSNGMTPALVSVRRVIDQIDAYLATALETDPFVGLKLPQGWTGGSSWRQDMQELVSNAIRPAFADYRQFLRSEATEAARPSELAGICHLPGGEAIYERLVKRFVTVPRDPSDIHRTGVAHATEMLVEEYAEVGFEAFGVSSPEAIFARLRTDPALRYRSEEEMLEHAREIIVRAWASIDGWLGARPDGPCDVRPVPAALAKDMPPAYYMVPAPDGSRPGTYFLNTHRPETRDRFSAEDTAFHEAIPGHHFDRALAAGLDDLPAFRRLRGQSVHAEGWGLYAERLADEMGLYTGAVERLGMLSADSWRAGRLVVDTGMHHLGWSRRRAVDFLNKWTAVNTPTIEQEVDRYIGWPGQALSYKMGQIEILRLRAKAEAELGESFDIVGFHDTLLTSGSVTIPVLTQLVEAWIDKTRP